MTIKTFFADLMGFTAKAEQSAKADAAAAFLKVQRDAERIEDFAFHAPQSVIGQGGSIVMATVVAPAPSIVGSTVSNLVTISGSFGRAIDSLVETLDKLEEELRQRRASRSATVQALGVLVLDKALTEDERTAINLEISDHADDAAAAAMRCHSSDETAPTPSPAPAAANLSGEDVAGNKIFPPAI